MTITVTNSAVEHITQQLKSRGQGFGIRVGVKTTGCSGMAYVLEFVEKKKEKKKKKKGKKKKKR